MPLPTPGYFLGVPTNLYGPVPTPGVPSTLFVDLFNNQTAAGNKTFTGAMSITRPDGVTRYLSLGNTAADWGRIENSNSSPGKFNLAIIGNQVTHANFGAVNIFALVDTSQDASGGAPSVFIRPTLASLSPLTARPLLGIFDGSIYRLRIMANGLLDFIHPAQAGAEETLAQWRLSDATSNAISLCNRSSANGEFAPRILGQATTTQQVTWDSQGAQDTGSSPLACYRAYIAAVGPLSTRPSHGWYNDSRLDATMEAGGSFALRQVGQGLRVAEGANAKQGVATLVAGTVTVANTSITANSRIQLTGQDNNATGALRVSASVVGTSFTITSSDVGATGVVAYFITEPS